MPSEVTPLLEAQSVNDPDDQSTTTLPPLLPAVEMLCSSEMTREDLFRRFPNWGNCSPLSRVAFFLATLLLTCTRLAEESVNASGVAERLAQKRELALKGLEDTWENHLHSQDTISLKDLGIPELLWTEIPLDDDSTRTIRGQDSINKYPIYVKFLTI